ncbi:unnamed protein product [Pedinophyceae sp. YPF-701]|nr:unnamed protein product [Pedinophyceae sp. YPF-701]
MAERLKRRKAPTQEGSLLPRPDDARSRRALSCCFNCQRDVTNRIHIRCAECTNVDACVECFAAGAQLQPHLRSHRYRVISGLAIPIFEPTWGADEEIRLLELIDQCGPGAWHSISEGLGTKTPDECREHYMAVYVHHADAPRPRVLPAMKDYDRARGVLQVAPAPAKGAEARKGGAVVKEEDGGKPAKAGAGGASKRVDGGAPGKGGKGGGTPRKSGPASPGPEAHHDKTGSTRHVRTAAETGGSEPLGGVANTAEVTGFNLKRGEFDHEWDNEAEIPIADLEFAPDDTAEVRRSKLRMLQIYNRRLDEREHRRSFVAQRGLLNVRRQQAADKRRSVEERTLRARLRPFARLVSASDMELMVSGLLVEHSLRQQIGRLKELRRHGIRTHAEAEVFESERRKRQALIAGAAGLGPHPVQPPSFYPQRAALGQVAAGAGGADAGAPVSERAFRYIARGGEHGDAPGGLPTGPGATAGPPRELQRLVNTFESDVPTGGDAKLKQWREAQGVELVVDGLPGASMLDAAEQELCAQHRILPAQFAMAKEALVLRQSEGGAGMVRSEVAALARLDPVRAGKVLDYLVGAGLVAEVPGE